MKKHKILLYTIISMMIQGNSAFSIKEFIDTHDKKINEYIALMTALGGLSAAIYQVYLVVNNKKESNDDAKNTAAKNSKSKQRTINNEIHNDHATGGGNGNNNKKSGKSNILSTWIMSKIFSSIISSQMKSINTDEENGEEENNNEEYSGVLQEESLGEFRRKPQGESLSTTNQIIRNGQEKQPSKELFDAQIIIEYLRGRIPIEQENGNIVIKDRESKTISAEKRAEKFTTFLKNKKELINYLYKLNITITDTFDLIGFVTAQAPKIKKIFTISSEELSKFIAAQALIMKIDNNMYNAEIRELDNNISRASNKKATTEIINEITNEMMEQNSFGGLLLCGNFEKYNKNNQIIQNYLRGVRSKIVDFERQQKEKSNNGIPQKNNVKKIIPMSPLEHRSPTPNTRMPLTVLPTKNK